ncbi:Hypothetical predicted protein [Marmota monax]|uniref:acetyl-CoA C-acetyltransferase n=1 Tax=Marmota monax TaxID=9995 RepID=A0A5E4CMQ9_MARMO|nr:Hypothetical predicted protein [Marmota monax]
MCAALVQHLGQQPAPSAGPVGREAWFPWMYEEVELKQLTREHALFCSALHAAYPPSWKRVWPAGITSENVAEWFGISREKQDTFAVASQQKAARAQSKGCFRAEIVPVTTTIHDDKGIKRSITVSQDEGIRPNTTMEGLAKLKPAFKDGGSTRDCYQAGCSALESGADQVEGRRVGPPHPRGPEVLCRLESPPAPPDVMDIGPTYAIPAALENAGQWLLQTLDLGPLMPCCWGRVLGIELRVLQSKDGAGWHSIPKGFVTHS